MLQGRLLRPGDPVYPAAAVINATRYAGARPAGIAICVTPEDAAVCVRWVRQTGVPFAVRSGGHSYAGFSNSDGLIIDVKAMNDVRIDPANATVTVAGGANNADVGAALARYGVYFPGGRCPTVGVSGLTLGGGWGFSCRHLGMTCDSLIATDLVDAAGQLVAASETENPDLFWAVRGAGGGNFGVHTSFTYRAVAAGDVSVFSLAWVGGDTPAIVDALCRMQVDGPRELGLRVAIRSQSRTPLTNPAPLDVDVIGLYWGPVADLETLLAPVERTQAPDARIVATMASPTAREFLAATTPTGTYGIKTGFMRGAPTPAAIAEMLEWVARMPGVPSRAQESTIGLYCWGGAVNDVPADATAFVHRDADLLFKCEALWEPQDDPALVAANLEGLEACHAAMSPHLAGGAYQNFTDRAQDAWQHAYYGSNFERLVEVKQAWDPDALFRFPQGIPTRI
ncbi:MAG: FAD-binding oxidoreductase [Thermomicrobiales bacterium]|nr:FAD-binding oxidoreductase [Thermomicrobiales bacterium]